VAISAGRSVPSWGHVSLAHSGRSWSGLLDGTEILGSSEPLVVQDMAAFLEEKVG
jgi:hypothetical protein